MVSLPYSYFGIAWTINEAFGFHRLFQALFPWKPRGRAMAAMGHPATSHGCAFCDDENQLGSPFEDTYITIEILATLRKSQEAFHHSKGCFSASQENTGHRWRFRMWVRFNRYLQAELFFWLRICEMTPCWGALLIITHSSWYHVFKFLRVDGLAGSRNSLAVRN